MLSEVGYLSYLIFIAFSMSYEASANLCTSHSFQKLVPYSVEVKSGYCNPACVIISKQ